MTKDELAAWWRWFSETECRGYSPLYERICDTVAGTEAVLDRLLSLPDHAQQPNMLFAAVHDLVLRGGSPALADQYDRPPSDDAGPIFVDVVIESWDELVPILETRRTQTNEIGRVALLAPALAALGLEDPPTIIDVGTSAGLTLLVDRCLIDYGPMGLLGPSNSPVQWPAKCSKATRRSGRPRSLGGSGSIADLSTLPIPKTPAGWSPAPGQTRAVSTGPVQPLPWRLRIRASCGRVTLWRTFLPSSTRSTGPWSSRPPGRWRTCPRNGVQRSPQCLSQRAGTGL